MVTVDTVVCGSRFTAWRMSLTVDQAFDPALEVRFPKIQQVSDTLVRKPYIGQNLLGVHREQSFNRF